MCVLLGFVILLYDVDLINSSGEELAITVFENIFGNYGNYLILFYYFSFL